MSEIDVEAMQTFLNLKKAAGKSLHTLHRGHQVRIDTVQSCASVRPSTGTDTRAGAIAEPRSIERVDWSVAGAGESGQPVRFIFKDGTGMTIQGTLKHWTALNYAQGRRERSVAKCEPAPVDPLDREMDGIRDCVRIDEPSQIFSLLWAMAQGGRPHGSTNLEIRKDERENGKNK